MIKPSPQQRLKVLRGVRKTAHRYDRYRAASMAFTLLVLAAVPLCGLARVDFWRGDHLLLGSAVTFKHALGGVIIAITAMYVVTFLSNLVAGRMFCGWGCPVGQVSRFGESVQSLGFTRADKVWANFKGASFSAMFVLSVMAWWVDIRVLWAGTPSAAALAWGVLGVGIVGAYTHGRWWRWEFCKTACPIGLYYTVVSPAKHYGVFFRNAEGSCIECDACDNVCPVALAPRDLLRAVDARGGVSMHEAPGRNHCLECGDCVRACEWMTGFAGAAPVPLLLGFHQGPQRIEKKRPPLRAPAASVSLRVLSPVGVGSPRTVENKPPCSVSCLRTGRGSCGGLCRDDAAVVTTDQANGNRRE